MIGLDPKPESTVDASKATPFKFSELQEERDLQIDEEIEELGREGLLNEKGYPILSGGNSFKEMLDWNFTLYPTQKNIESSANAFGGLISFISNDILRANFSKSLTNEKAQKLIDSYNKIIDYNNSRLIGLGSVIQIHKMQLYDPNILISSDEVR